MGLKLIIIFCIAVAVSAIPFGSSSKANEEIEEISKFKANKPSAFRIVNNEENDEEDENYKNSYLGSENKEPAPVVEINKLDTPTNKLLPFHVPDHKVENGDKYDDVDNESDYADDESDDVDDEYDDVGDDSDEKHNSRKDNNEDKRDNPAPVVELVENDKPLNGELPFHVPVKKESTESEINDLVNDENEELNEDDSPIDEQNSFYRDTVKKNVKNRDKYEDNYENEPAPVVEIDDHETPKDKELPFHVPEKRENIEKSSENESKHDDENVTLHQKENRNYEEDDNSEEENKDEEESDDDINESLDDEGEDFNGPTHYKLPYLFDAEEHHKPHKEKQTFAEVKSEINALEQFDEPIHYKFPISYYTETRKDHTETKKSKRSRYDDESKKQAPSEELNETQSPKNYEFQYSINDSESGDVKNVKEARDGDAVQGSYSFIQPDGLERIVEYTADKKNGFNAVVRYKEAPNQPMIKPIEHRDNPIPNRRSHERFPASYSNFQYAAPISNIISFPNSVTSFSASQNKN